MNISFKKAREDYYLFSGKVSDLCRQLNFAAIAVIWILKTEPTKAGGVAWMDELLFPLGLSIAALACDLAQYLWQTVAWGVFQSMKGKAIRAMKAANQVPPATFHVSGAINLPSLILFWGKALLTVAVYAFLLSYMFGFLAR